MVILKEKPALSKTQQTTVQIAEIGQMLFERCISCCCYSVRSEFFCPRYLDEKLFEAPLRASNVCDADAKALVATKEGLPSPRSAACSHCL